MLILVRHGRTALNASGCLQGRLDEPLDELGHLQAKAVAERVGAVDELMSSPLIRAQQTADAFGMPYALDERWIELSYGEYEGVPVSDVPSARSGSGGARTRRSSRQDGESLTTLATRVRAACVELVERARDRTIAVVSHVSPIKTAVAWALDAGIEISWRAHLSHASICRIDMRRTGPVLLTFNETPLAG